MQILQFLKTFRAQVPVSGPERYFSILTNFPLMFPAFCIYQTELNVDDHLEDYIIFLTLTVICCWVVRLVVGEYLFSLELNLSYEGFLVTKRISSDDMAAVFEFSHLQEVYTFHRKLAIYMSCLLDIWICNYSLILVL